MALALLPFVAAALVGLSLLGWSLIKPRYFWMRIITTAVLFGLLTAVLAWIVGSPLEPQFADEIGNERITQQILDSSWWLLGARLFVELIRAVARIRKGRILPDLAGAVIYLAVLMTIVKTVFGFPIGGIVATSGIIAIVLGLALQSTLADVFAGIAVGIERPYAIGDLVWIEGPIEGEIVEVNWRSVQIRTFGNDIATVPNSVVAKSRIINRSVPTPRRSETIEVSCDAARPPEHVFELLRWAILLCPDILATPAPSFALIRIGQRTNGYAISFSVADTRVLWQAKGTLMREVLRQLRASEVGGGERPPPAHDGASPPARTVLDISLFEELPPESRRELSNHVVRRLLDTGEPLFSEGGTEASLFVVASGVLEVSKRVNGADKRIGRISAGDYIGEIGLLTGAPHAASVKALTPCIIYELKKDDMAPLLHAQPQLMQTLECSARRGQALIDRGVAATVGTAAGPAGQLFDRMRAFFHLHGH